VQARDGDEKEVVDRSAGGGNAPSLSLGGQDHPPPPPPTPTTDEGFLYVTNSLSQRPGSLIRRLADDTDLVLRNGSLFSASFLQPSITDPGASSGGMAIRNDLQSGTRDLLRLEQLEGQGSYRLLSLDTTTSGSVFQQIATFSSTPRLFGLGTIGSRILLEHRRLRHRGDESQLPHRRTRQPGPADRADEPPL